MMGAFVRILRLLATMVETTGQCECMSCGEAPASSLIAGISNGLPARYPSTILPMEKLL